MSADARSTRVHAEQFGAFAIVGNPVAGRLGDRFGRKRVAACVMVLFPLASLAFFAAAAGVFLVSETARRELEDLAAEAV